MNLSSQVTSRALSERLEKLGVRQGESIFWWCGTDDCPETIVQSDTDRYCESCGMAGDNYDAFTIAELFERMLMTYASLEQHSNNYRAGIPRKDMYGQHENATEALGLMFEYLITNGRLSV